MAHLIEKDPIVAEIEKSIERAKAERVLHPGTILAAKNYLLIEDYNKLLSFVNALEVKEVDIKKEVINFMSSDEYQLGEESGCILVAKHFFELGLKAKQG